MDRPIPDDLLYQLNDFLIARTGLYFLPRRRADLERGLAAAAADFGLPDAEACARWLLLQELTREQIETLAAHLTIGETYFYRDPRVFEALETRVLPKMIEGRRDHHLRIWSAGCATGEEAYTLAILVDRLLPHRAGWHVTILATDINSQALRKAEAGIYTEWSFRDAPPWIRSYFQKLPDGRSELVPRIRHMVLFNYLNLVEDVFPALETNTNAMDIIFCRNVLMYLSPDKSKKIVSNLRRALVLGGYLVVSATELSTTAFGGFSSVSMPGALLYRRDDEQRAGQPSLLLSELPPVSLPAAPVIPPEPPASPPPNIDHPATRQPQTPDLYIQAAALYRTGAYGEAASRLREWLADHSDDSHAMSLLARACANLGELDQAHNWAEKAIARDRLNPSAHYLYATICQEEDDLNCARTALQRALYLQPDLVLAHYALGMIAFRTGDRKQAAKYLRNALDLVLPFPQDETLPESEGMTAGRLGEIIRSTLARERL